MSNNITGNPWILDTAADNIVAPGTKIRPKLIIWSGADTAADRAQIEDGSEVVKFDLTIDANGATVIVEPPSSYWQDGLSLGVLDSGKVYLYF